MKIRTHNSLFIEIHRLKLSLEGSSLTTSNKPITESTAVHKKIWILEKYLRTLLLSTRQVQNSSLMKNCQNDTLFSSEQYARLEPKTMPFILNRTSSF